MKKFFVHGKEFSKVQFVQVSSSLTANSFTENQALEKIDVIKIHVFSLAQPFLTSYVFFCTKFFPIHFIYSALSQKYILPDNATACRRFEPPLYRQPPLYGVPPFIFSPHPYF